MAFTREVQGYARSLPQLLYHKDRIVDLLIRHLNVENSLALEPLLSLVATLARDLQEEFYPYFNRFFQTISSLLKNANAKLLEVSVCPFSDLMSFFTN
jgi:U3 small nucleolar RNA-associated protein 20